MGYDNAAAGKADDEGVFVPAKILQLGGKLPARISAILKLHVNVHARRELFGAKGVFEMEGAHPVGIFCHVGADGGDKAVLLEEEAEGNPHDRCSNCVENARRKS